jgi:3D (Asp-Asp-Asp) domain-containing protein
VRTTILTFLISLLSTTAWAGSPLTVRITLSGYADNNPRGTEIAHPVIHHRAGGVGTYNNPITFAANPRTFRPGTKIYVPYLRKYFIIEDDAQTAIATAGHGLPLIVLWAGGTASSNVDRLLATESAYTRNSAQVIVNPTPNHPVNAGSIFADSSTPR